MAKNNQNNSENKPVYKNDTYLEFIKWFALPTYLREQETGLRTQQEFADRYEVSKDTLSLWKDRSDFEERVDKIRKDWGHEKTPDIIQGIYRAAIKGNAKSQRLWLELHNPERLRPTKTPDNEITLNDIRFLIDCLPTKELHDKYYTFLRELLDDSAKYQDVTLEELKKNNDEVTHKGKLEDDPDDDPII